MYFFIRNDTFCVLVIVKSIKSIKIYILVVLLLIERVPVFDNFS